MKKKKLSLGALLLFLSAATFSLTGFMQQTSPKGKQIAAKSASSLPFSGNEIAPDRVVFKLKSSVGDQVNTQARITFELLSLSTDFYKVRPALPAEPAISNVRRTSKPLPLAGVFIAELNPGTTPQWVIENLKTNPDVEYVEPIYRHHLSAVPNDPLLSQQTYLDRIRIQSAWDVIKGSQGNVVIAVIDGGTEIAHPDLADNLWVNSGEVAGNKIDDDHNGFIDDLHGWNFPLFSGDATGLAETPFSANHGTTTAGIACAVTDNGVGVAGMSWNAKLMAINAADPTTDGNIIYGYEGIIYAVNNGADIINLSWSRHGGAKSIFEQEVIEYAFQHGCGIIAAAGNENDETPSYPAAYNHVISVTATDNSDIKASFSNYNLSVDVSAPGVSIFSTLKDGHYGLILPNGSGTSFSCPIVSGAAALVKTLRPNWTGYQVAEQVRATADEIDEINGLRYAGKLGKGRLNASRAVTEFTSPALQIADLRLQDSGQDGIIHPGDTVQVFAAFTNYLAAASNISVQLRSHDPNVTILDGNREIANLGSLQQSEPLLFSLLVKPHAPEGHEPRLSFAFQGGTYRDQQYFSLIIKPTFANLSINNIETSVTNVGRLGFADSDQQSGGVGFLFHGGENLLYESAIISGTGPARISTSARFTLSLFEQDFRSVEGQDIRIMTPGSLTDQESIAIFADESANLPLGMLVTQKSYAMQAPPNDDFIILTYDIKNNSDSTWTNFHFGLFFDWDIGEPLRNSARYDAERNLAYVWVNNIFVGTALLSSANVSMRILDNQGIDFNISDSFSDSEKWRTISEGVQTSELLNRDVAYVIAAGSFEVTPGESTEVAFALVAGESSQDITTNALAAQQLWQKTVTSVQLPPETTLPSEFSLSQNYPNPFNPVTEIQYDLPEVGFVELAVFNLLGQKVKTLVNSEQVAGTYAVRWHGDDDFGRQVASGVYVYRLRSSGEFLAVRKMLLVQ